MAGVNPRDAVIDADVGRDDPDDLAGMADRRGPAEDGVCADTCRGRHVHNAGIIAGIKRRFGEQSGELVEIPADCQADR